MKKVQDLSYLITTELFIAQSRHAIAKRHGKFKYENDRKFKDKRDRKEMKEFY